jgi:hypothetical protein
MWLLTPPSELKNQHVSEEHFASIFMIREYTKQETSLTTVASRASSWFLGCTFNPED